MLIDQRSDESRTLEDTLSRAWRVASELPRRELTMVSTAEIAAYYTADVLDPDTDPSNVGTAEAGNHG